MNERTNTAQGIPTQMIALKLLQENKGQIEGVPANPRFVRDHKFTKLRKSIEDNPEMLYLRELLVYPYKNKFVIIGGNMRYRAMKDLAYSEAPCKVIPEDATPEMLRAYTVKDNNGFGEWDWDMLANEWDEVELEDWGLDLPTMWEGDDSPEEQAPTEETEDGTYSKGIKVPTYEPSDKKPELSDLCDTNKYKELSKRIDEADISDELREFLHLSASRHIVFNYQKIADYYAHSNKQVQELMEESALVIVDFNKAIEGGFVKLQGQLWDIVEEEQEDEGND